MILLPWQPQVVLNDVPKTNISITTFFVGIKQVLYNVVCCHGYQIKEIKLIIGCCCHENKKFPKTNISITIFFVDIKNNFYTICIVTMVTKFKNSGCLHDFVTLETTVVLNSFQKTNIFVLYFFINVKNDLHTILFVAMVTKLNKSS